MRKLIKILVLSAAVCLLLTTPIFAANPVFNPNSNQNISIDGKMRTYELPVANYDGYTMLPLRALVTDLGIPNDDAHIQYDSGTKSVTLVSADGGTKIWLQQGNPGAWVVKDGVKTDLTLDCPVQNYQGSLYIPVKFVAESLDMLVVYDAPTRTVLIRTPESIAALADALALSEKAEEPKKMQMTIDGQIHMAITGATLTIPLTADMKTDVSDLSHMKMALEVTTEMLGQADSTQMYLDGNELYTVSGGEVSKTTAEAQLASDYLDEWAELLNAAGLAETLDKELSARMFVKPGKDDKHIVISGDYAAVVNDAIVMLEPIIGELPEDALFHVRKCVVDITLDKDTGLPVSVYLDVGLDMDMSGVGSVNVEVRLDINIQYEDVDVVVPQDIIDKTQKLPQIV